MVCICSEVSESHYSLFKALVITDFFFKSKMFKSLGLILKSILKVSAECTQHLLDSLESLIRARKLRFPPKAMEAFI